MVILIVIGVLIVLALLGKLSWPLEVFAFWVEEGLGCIGRVIGWVIAILAIGFVIYLISALAG